MFHYGSMKAAGRGSYHCFRHRNEKASLIANNDRGVVTCQSPQCDLKRGSDIFEIIKLVEGI